MLLVILNSLKKSLLKKSKASGVMMSVSLAAGLCATHTLVPPAPRPIAAGNLGLKDAATIIMITGAGGAFGTVLKATPIGDYLGSLLSTLSIGILVPFIIAGAMTVSHANDSFFWVVAEFSGMDVQTAYKSQTMATLIQGIVTIVLVSILAVLFV